MCWLRRQLTHQLYFSSKILLISNCSDYGLKRTDIEHLYIIKNPLIWAMLTEHIMQAIIIKIEKRKHSLSTSAIIVGVVIVFW